MSTDPPKRSWMQGPPRTVWSVPTGPDTALRVRYDDILWRGGREMKVMALALSLAAAVVLPTVVWRGKPPRWFRLAGGVTVLVGAIAAFRVALIRGRATETHFVLQDFRRIQKLAWSEVVGARAMFGDSETGRTATLEVRTTDGRIINVNGLGRWGPSPLPVTKMADIINEMAQGVHQTQ